MQESNADISYTIQRLPGMIIPVLLLGIVAILSPFAIQQINVPPPYYPPPPGWESSVAIYLWGARYSVAPPSLSLSLPFVIMTLIYFVIQVAESMRKMQTKYGVMIEIVLFPIWISICQLTYGTLQDWTLIQLPLLPIAGISILLVVHWNQQRC